MSVVVRHRVGAPLPLRETGTASDWVNVPADQYLQSNFAAGGTEQDVTLTEPPGEARMAEAETTLHAAPGGSIIPPLPPAPPSPNFNSIYLYDQPYTIAAGTYRYSVGDLMFHGQTSTSTLINNGTLWIDGQLPMSLGSDLFICRIAVSVEKIVNHGVAVALAHLTSNVDQANAAAFNFFKELENSGLIYAWAEYGGAAAIEGTGSVVVNSGTIAASAETGFAVAINMVTPGTGQGGAIVNQVGGRILAEAPAAIGIAFEGAGLPPGWSDDIHVNNAGLIHAVTTNVNIASVGLSFEQTIGQVVRVVNSGTITADTAIIDVSASSGHSMMQIGIQVISNLAGGTINGDITLDRGNDIIDNDGRINGWVFLGEGDDLFDTSGGTVNGVVDLGWGADTYKGSTKTDYLYGGNGNDIVEGNGGNDLLMGGGNDDTMVGGAGNDGLFGEYGNDRIVTSGGDFAWGGPGDDRIEAGDFAFEQVSGNEGFDTLVLPAGVRLLDLSIVVGQQGLSEIEKIVLGGGKELVVRAADIPSIAGGASTLRIEGASTDTIDLVGAWTAAGTVAIEGADYRRFQLDGKTLLVKGDANVVLNATPPAGAGGLDPVPGGALAPLPGEGPVDFTPNETWFAGYTLTQSVTVNAEETWWNDQGIPVLYASYNEPIDLTNFGWLLSSSDTSDRIVYLAVDLGFTRLLENHGTVTASSTFDGWLQVESQGLYVIAASHGTDIVNHGLIEALSLHGNAIGISDTDNLTNHGEIHAYSEHGYAFGFLGDYNNSLLFANDGTITVTGGLGAVGATVYADEATNGGRIEATTLLGGGADSIGVQFWKPEPASLTNSGVIVADIAVQTLGGDITITNQNRLEGRVELGAGTDRIVNIGVITGRVAMGDGNDVFDGTAGKQAALVDGGAGDDTLTGGGSDDRLAGGLGADSLRGGGGADRFVFLATGDSSAGGMDRIRDFNSGVDRIDLVALGEGVTFGWTEHTDASDGSVYSLVNVAANGGQLAFRVDSRLVATDFLLLNVVVGNAGSDTLAGSGETDLMRGLDGADRLQGLGSDDSLYGDAGNDRLEGGTGDDLVEGGLGDDLLNGGAGDDLMTGGLGDDTYVRDDRDDVIVEIFGEGVDTVQTAVDCHLPDELEHILMIGNAAISGWGNWLDNRITGNSGDNRLYGDSGNDFLDGGGGADLLDGGFGDDIFFVDAGDVVVERDVGGTDEVRTTLAAYTLAPWVERLAGTSAQGQALTGNDLANFVVSSSGHDILNGLSGDDWLDGGSGADTMRGGTGDDHFIVNETGDVVIEAAGEGLDTVDSEVSFTLGANVEDLTLTGDDAIDGTGNSLANVLTGNARANRLDGGGGTDIMAGGLGNDTYVVETAGDLISETAGAGVDTVQSAISYTLDANFENLTLTGATAINGSGNALANLLTGNAAANRLDGGGGGDTMAGGLGDDIYFVDHAGDVVTEGASGGTDLVQAWVSHTLGANVENLTLTGAAAINGNGNSLTNHLIGNAAANLLNGLGGADTMSGGLGDDTYVVDMAGDAVSEAVSAGTDLVQSAITYTLGANVENLALTGTAAINGSGNSAANILTGNSADNILSGAAGVDEMRGGGGNDSYVVDNAGDLVIETSATGGIDKVTSTVSFTLGGNVETLTLTGTAAVNATGNGLANVLAGNSAANILDGKAGADTMQGAGGNDTYIVDNALDQAIEVSVSHGLDQVNASVSYTLAAKLENLTLTGAGAINATGNAAANVITGNGAANVLNGMAGADVMNGGLGNDTYIVDNAGDQAIETSAAGGTDHVQSKVSFTLGANVENLTLTGTGAINATGNGLANLLIGNGAANILDGKVGADTMQGGAGNDIYVVDNNLDQAIEVSASHGVDTVNSSVSYTLAAKLENLTLTGSNSIDGTGNAAGNIITGNSAKNFLDGGAGSDTLFGGGGADRFVFANSPGATNVDIILDFATGIDKLLLDDAVFTALGAGALAAGALVMGSAATDANDRILYDAGTGNLYYDRDGTGAAAAVQFATLDNMPATLAAGDFLVI